MSTQQNIVQYNIDVSTEQPNTGAMYYVQLSLQQTSTFGDAEAVALFNAQAAAVPSGWTPVSTQMNKVTTDMTQLNWNPTTQAFE